MAVGEHENIAAWLYGVDDLRLLPYDVPKELGPYDVRLQMKAVGICGSDVHYLKKMQLADFRVEEPMVIGHESAGTVVEVGAKVTRCKVGDDVAIEPGVSCGRCERCKDGRYNLCPKMRFFATPPVHGSLANQIVHPEDLCFTLPHGVSLEEGAMCEPLSVAVHACRRAGPLIGCHVAVLGAGPIGLVTLLVAKAFGAASVTMTDVHPERIDFAKRLGADATVLLGKEDPEGDVTRVQASVRDKSPVDVTFDCVGVTSSMTLALRLTRTGGKVLLIGMGHELMEVPLTAAAAREVDLLGVFRYLNTYPLCLELIQSKKVDVKPLITHRFRFTQADVTKGFEVSAKGGNAIKVMFNL